MKVLGGDSIGEITRQAWMSRSKPLSAAVCRATVVGWSGPQMKTKALAKPHGCAVERCFFHSGPTSQAAGSRQSLFRQAHTWHYHLDAGLLSSWYAVKLIP